jgi:hypothetical protein
VNNRLGYIVLMALVVSGCAGMQRECSSSCASQVGADWVVVQTTQDGKPFRCWELRDVSVANEPNSDGIYWQSPDGHLVHIANHYVRVQVEHGKYESALSEIGMTRAQCTTLRSTQVESAR